MDWALNIVIGNFISLIAGVFLLLSMWVNDEKQAYKYQFLNAFILMISSVFFLSWTGALTMAIAAARNMMVYKEKLTLNWVIFFIFISVVLGFMVNTLGLIGLLPIIAIVQITLSNYSLKSIKTIKLSFIINTGIYVFYFFMISDFSSAIIESITTLTGTISLFKLIFHNNNH